eukprot:6441533-Prymnesium_polylepis.1
MMHGALPDVESLEQSGQLMYNAAVDKHVKKIKRAEDKVRDRRRSPSGMSLAVEALAVLHREHCVCKHGATTPALSVSARTAPSPVILHHARRRTPEDLDLAAIINEQQAEINRLTQLPDVAKREPNVAAQM